MSTSSADPCAAGACPTCDGDSPVTNVDRPPVPTSVDTVHDRHCPVTTSVSPCPVCVAIGKGRGEERQRYAETWKANIARLESDWYARGYSDGAAGRWRLR